MYSAEDLFGEEAEEGVERYGGNDDAEDGNQLIENENPDDNIDNEQETRETVKPKRVIRNPQPKLNADTLKGPKGLLALEGYFDRAKFKGRGHEEEDLNVILKTYEYFCHRLFPKFPFQDCISKIETLGSKGIVQTHLKKIRLGMEVDEDKPVNDENEDVLPLEESSDIENRDPEIEAISRDIPVELTEEQLERIRINREKAQKLREERLINIQPETSEENDMVVEPIAGQNSVTSISEAAVEVPCSNEDSLTPPKIVDRSVMEYQEISTHNENLPSEVQIGSINPDSHLDTSKIYDTNTIDTIGEIQQNGIDVVMDL